MKRLLIFAWNYHNYMNFCRHFNINPYKSARYVVDWTDVNGWWIDQPVILLEGYENNPNYTVEFMHNVGRRFENIGFISEGEIWDESANI